VGGDRDGGSAGRAETPLQLVAEHQVGELGLEVGVLIAIATLGLKVIEVNSAAPVTHTADRHDPPARGRQQRLQDQAGERERAEVIGGQGGLEAVHGALVSRVYPAGVVDQQVKARVLGA
jgi:hypothetical protein